MKILERGTPREQKPHQMTCDGCGTRFEATIAEGKPVSDWRDGDFVRWQCPVCRRPVDVDARML